MQQQEQKILFKDWWFCSSPADIRNMGNGNSVFHISNKFCTISEIENGFIFPLRNWILWHSMDIFELSHLVCCQCFLRLHKVCSRNLLFTMFWLLVFVWVFGTLSCHEKTNIFLPKFNFSNNFSSGRLIKTVNH